MQKTNTYNTAVKKHTPGETMKRIPFILLAAALILLSVVPLAAQSKANSFIKEHSFTVYFNSYLDGFNNGDLRATDETSVTSVQDSDDKLLIGHFQLGAIFRAKLKYDILFYTDIYKVGYWGNDCTEYRDPEPLYVRHLFVSVPVKKSGSTLMHITLGRSRFALFSEKDIHHNYVLADNIDALVFSMNKKNWGLQVFADLFSMNSPVDSIYDLKAERHEYTVDGFNGDVNIIRFALLPHFTIGKSDTRMLLRPFFMFARVGAVGTGTANSGGYEQSEAGTSGNEADNDWLMLAGASLKLKAGKLSILGEVSFSKGKDRKRAGTPDVDITGLMGHFSAALSLSPKTTVGLAVLYATGASTDADGNYENYGYTGFKADKLGGFLFKSYYGAYPYAVLDTAGLSMEPVASYRRAPTAAAVFRLNMKEIDLFKVAAPREGLNINVESWFYLDTSSSSTDYSSGSLPADALDHRRFGKFMGYEIDLKISYSLFGGMMETGIQSGVFIPYDFYLIPASDQNAPYGKDIFWGISAFAKLRF